MSVVISIIIVIIVIIIIIVVVIVGIIGIIVGSRVMWNGGVICRWVQGGGICWFFRGYSRLPKVDFFDYHGVYSYGELVGVSWGQHSSVVGGQRRIVVGFVVDCAGIVVDCVGRQGVQYVGRCVLASLICSW